MSTPPNVLIITDADNGQDFSGGPSRGVEIALGDAGMRVKANGDGSLVPTAPVVDAPGARQSKTIVVGTSGSATAFCAFPVERGFDSRPGDVCVMWPSTHSFSVTITRLH